MTDEWISELTPLQRKVLKGATIYMPRQMGKRTILKGYNLRDVRPMAATEAERQGYSTEDLRKGLAHTTVTTTEGYLRDRLTVESPVRLTLPRRAK